MTRELHVETLLGRKVADSTGAPIGRIEEIEVEDDTITYALAGPQAMIERWWGLRRISRKRTGYRIRWDQLTWTDARVLRTTCTVAELEKI